MHIKTRGLYILAAGLLVACGRGDEEPRRIDTGTPAAAQPAQTLSDSVTAHGEHVGHSPAAAGGATPHTGEHGAASGAEHRQHQAAAAHGAREHAAAMAHGAQEHAARHQAHRQGAEQPHAGHADTTPRRMHAQHAGRASAHPQHTDSAAHQQHADPAAHQHADTARAHAAPAATDTAHAAHAAHAAPGDSGAAHQHTAAQEAPHAGHGAAHNMPMIDVGGGVMIIGMAQAFPTFTFAVPSDDGTPLGKTGLYLTQPAIMANVESRGSRIVLRTTLNFEGITQREGELTFGGWGEGYLDKRHPHTLVHELMLSGNFFRGANSFSISLGKGFAPYGTDDPMSRPILKYPTNHHLSQALERWTVNGIAQLQQWSVEAGIFGGAEPTSPYDFSNIKSFGDSWSARLTRRFGREDMGAWPWEFSVSHAYIEEKHHEEIAITRLYNAAIRHEHNHGPSRMYALFEASRSEPNHGEGYFSLLAEGSLAVGRHKPYGRVEYATRPEYEREGAPGTDDFFRYHHDDEAIGATRWIILTGGYGFTVGGTTTSMRPFVEAQYNRVSSERGGIDPNVLFGRRQFWSISLGARIFLGGEAMRMGAYGVLDPMTRMHKPMMTATASEHIH